MNDPSVLERYLSPALEAADQAGVRDSFGAQFALLSLSASKSSDIEELLSDSRLPLFSKLAMVEGMLGEKPVDPLRDLLGRLIDDDRVDVLRSAEMLRSALGVSEGPTDGADRGGHGAGATGGGEQA